MKVSIGIHTATSSAGFRFIKMLDFPELPEYVLPNDVKVDLNRPQLFKFDEQDQFCRVVTHEEFEAELTK